MNLIKTTLSAAALAAIVFALTGAAHAEDKGTIGISMPTKTSARWIADGDNMVKSLEAKGYKADLQYADNDIPTQLSQIENMITKKEKALVIAAIDGTTLSNALQKAAEAGIKVISYDRLIVGSPNVDYYATFDNFKVGVEQGSSLLHGLGVDQGKKGPFNVELFGGSADDTNAFFFYNGAMSVLQPEIDKGVLVIPSKQMGMDKVATLRWEAATAQTRMENLLSRYYTTGHVDGVLSPYDGLSIGILAALKSVGYGTSGTPFPIITGQDAEIPSVKAIIAHEQYSTIFKDTRNLAKVAANMVDDVLQGKKPEINDTKTYNNKIKIVPSFLLSPVLVDASNWKQVLVDSDYYKPGQLQ
jgi:putative multiple sugar transport system substrate-binding protein